MFCFVALANINKHLVSYAAVILPQLTEPVQSKYGNNFTTKQTTAADVKNNRYNEGLLFR